MVPPGDILGSIPIWVGVCLALVVSQVVSGYVFYQRVISLILQGKGVARFDRPLERLKGVITVVLGQRKVLQRVGAKDRSGLGHVVVFWGFLSFVLSYLIFKIGRAHV